MMRQEHTKPADRVFLLLILIWLIFGLIMLASASSPVGYAKFGDTYYFIKRQLLFGVLPGAFLFLIAGHVNFRFWQKAVWVLYAAAIILLLLVFVPGVGVAINGSHSWIHFFGYSFQPSELAKLALVLMLAKMLAEKKGEFYDVKTDLLPLLAIISPIIILVASQDLGTLSILLAITFVMFFAGGMNRMYLTMMSLLGVIAFGALLLFVPYRVQRLTTFLHPELDPKGIGYQINQAYLAVGSGGFFGLGLGNSRQKFQYLPEVQADSIFAIIAEEMGFLITSAFLVLLVVTGWRGLKIARGAPDQFGRLLVLGIVVWFMSQSFLNIGAIIGILPLTGVPLPFVSHGGSALVVALAATGVVANVSKEARG
jgi:cell division protein FtsW